MSGSYPIHGYPNQDYQVYGNMSPGQIGMPVQQPLNRSFVSDVSMGGLTSKRSHKHLLENVMPMPSKSESQHDESEPDDPEENYQDEPSVAYNDLRMQRSTHAAVYGQQRQQQQPPCYELDLQSYMQMKNRTPQPLPAGKNRAKLDLTGGAAARSFQIPNYAASNNLIVN